MRQSSSAGNVRTQTPIREKGQSLSYGSQIKVVVFLEIERIDSYRLHGKKKLAHT